MDQAQQVHLKGTLSGSNMSLKGKTINNSDFIKFQKDMD